MTCGRAHVIVNSRNDADLLAEVWDALVAAQSDESWLFRRGDELAEVRGGMGRSVGPTEVGVLASVVVQFESAGRRGNNPVGCPTRLERQLVAFPDGRLPKLERVVTVPLLAPDGSLREERGYDAKTMTWLEPTVRLPMPVPERPSGYQVEMSRKFLDVELLGDFPFEGEADRANAAGLVLLPFLRAIIDAPTPLHVCSKPTVGAGASTLVRACLAPGLGIELTSTAGEVPNEEMAKMVLTLARSGADYVFLDNVVRLTDTSALAAALTSGAAAGRVLGRSEMVRVPFTPVWSLTGNNPRLSEELVRRSQPIRLVPEQARAWEREWRHPDLVRWALRERGRLSWAALCLLRGWVADGAPLWAGAGEHSFPAWAGAVGGAVEWAGWGGFASNFEAVFDDGADESDGAWERLAVALRERFADGEFAPDQAYETALLLGVVGELVSPTARDQRVALGRAMGGRRDKIVGGFRLSSRRVQGRRWWRLVAARGPR